MSDISARPSRRAAASRRKAAIVEDSSEDEMPIQVKQESEDEFTPAPQKSPKKGGRRKTTTEVSSTPRDSARTRRPRATESIEPSIAFEQENEAPGSEPTSPTKRAPARKSVGRLRKSRLSAAPELPPKSSSQASSLVSSLPTPQSSESPEPTQLKSPSPLAPTPLSEINEAALNERPPTASSDKTVEFTKVDARTTVLEKPMDIMVRTRNQSMPKVDEIPGPKQRTVITYLILTNFKSYAGKQEVGPFHASFSSVVGPNGSGKSNVIDSLLFVFGFRASKMRQGKLSALIHNSAQYPDLDFCEVEVHFQEVMDLPAGGSEPVPDSGLVISRRAFKNNSSNYYINGKTSNFTAVTTLLKDRGVDLDHKRFLILQGEVESIAQMKPKAANEHDDGLLEYLEDIIGTSKYKTPIEEAAKETEELNEVCIEKSSRVQHVEKEKNGLEDQKNKALAYLRDENELAMKQSALYQIFMTDCNDVIEVTRESVAQMQTALEAELQRHHGSEDFIKQLEKQHKTGQKELEKLEKDTQGLLKELSKLDKEIVKFEEKKKYLAGKQKKLEKTLQTSKFAASEAETTTKQCSDDIERNLGLISELEKEIKVEEKELNEIRENLKSKTQGLSDEIAAKQKSLEPWKNKINEKQSAMAVAQSELDILREKDNAGAVAIAEIDSKIASYEKSKAKTAEDLEECKAEKQQVEKQVQHVQGEIDELISKEPALRSKLSNVRQKADEARASLSATQTQGNVLTGLMRLKDSGRINGFHGRLGNLGTIDQKYDVAISTACPSLDNIVVDSVEVGQQCIEYLRKNNLGRANFICLDKLPRRDLSAIETPENIPRLFDLVKSKDDRFSPAFFSVLQNTLVASNLQQANRVAYGAKRWRVVTVDGELIDKSGTMSGGGTRVAKGAMSSKLVADITKDQVAKLEVDRDTVEKAFTDLQQQQRELQSALRELRDRIPQLETKAQKLALELESYDRNIADSQRRIQEISAEQQTSKADKTRMSSLQKTIASVEKEVSKLHEETAGVEEEIKSLQDKIMEIGGVQLRSQKAKVDGLREQINTLTDVMSTAEVNKSKAQKQKVKHEKTYAEAEKEIAGLSAEIEKFEDEMKNQMESNGEFREQAEEAKEALETKKEELSALKAELEQKTEELNETRGVEIEMRNKLEEGQKSLAETERKLRHWEEKLGKLSLQKMSDYGEPDEADELPTYTKDELLDMDKNALKEQIAELEEKSENVQVDTAVLAEYRRRVEEHAARSNDLATAVSARDMAKKRCDELRRLRLEGFMEGFSTISLRLKEMYQMITMGGNAELELVDTLDPFSEGILFSVMPPKKSWKNISNLSGGEKTLSSLALVFALHHYKPTPLYVMDEIDAALDFRNVSIVASYIKERTKNAQFIVISLRNNMFELAARLVGVYKVNHMTKSVTVENRDYIARA